MLSKPPFNLLSNLERVDDAIDANGDLADEILNSALQFFGLEGPEADSHDPSMDWRGAADSHHIDKARSTLRQMYRDWSTGGAAERQACYHPVLEDLMREFAHLSDKSNARILIPGVGLGRLMFEVCRHGYTVEGNEISWHQLIASNWALNHTEKGKAFDLYPFAAEFSNVISRDHQLQVVRIPDVHVGSILEESSKSSRVPSMERMGMSVGDFTSLYKDGKYSDAFDAVATVFFIDTAPNLFRYVETIRHCLRPGGVWINLGPLLWHFEDRGPSTEDDQAESGRTGKEPTGIEEPGSFELTNEEILELVQQMGFGIEGHELRCDGTGYVNNPKSMLQNTYRPSHFVARKRGNALTRSV